MKLLGYGLLFLAALAAGFALGAPAMVERAGQKALARLEARLGVEVELGAVDWTLDGELTLEDVTVRLAGAPEGEPPLFEAARVEVASAPSWMAQTVRLERLAVTDGRVSVVRRHDGSLGALDLLARARGLVGDAARDGGQSGVGEGGGGLGLRRLLEPSWPELVADDLTVDLVLGELALPEGLEVPTRVTLSGGRFTASNPALLREENRYEVSLAFADSTLDPGFGLELDTTVPLAGGDVGTVPEVTVRFDRPARLVARGRVLAVAGAVVDADRVRLDRVALSVPIAEGATADGDPVDPAVTLERLELVLSGARLDGEVRGEATPGGLRAALGALRAQGPRAALAHLARVKAVRPALVFERRPGGHNFQDLVPSGATAASAGAAPAPGPTDKALGPLMEATLAATARISARAGRDEAGKRVREGLARLFGQLESTVVDGSTLVWRASKRLPLGHTEVVIEGGHFVWRDATRLVAGGVGLKERLERVDVTVSKRGDVLRFEGAFAMPGAAAAAGGGQPPRNTFVGSVALPTGDVELHATLERLRLHPYRHVFPDSLPITEKAEIRGVDASVVWSPSTRVARLSGEATWLDGVVVLPAVASEPMGELNVGVALDLQLDTRDKTLVLSDATLELDGVKAHLDGEVTRYDGAPKLAVTFDLPRSRCQDLVEALPQALIPMLEGLELKGTFAWRVDVHLDTTSMASLRYETVPALYAFEVLDMGYRVNLDAVRGAFLHRIQERDGTVREMLVGPGSPGWVPLDRISDFVVNGVTTTEDGSFFRHDGFSTFAIRESIVTNLEKGGFVRGASTVSQQLVKNLFLSREKTISRKIQEMFITWQMERTLDKRLIMALYLNVIEFGPGLYGISKAARHYFDKHPSQLDLVESVFLVSLIPNPRGYYHQFQRGEVTDGWRRHLRWIATVMRDRGKISDGELASGGRFSPAFRPVGGGRDAAWEDPGGADDGGWGDPDDAERPPGLP